MDGSLSYGLQQGLPGLQLQALYRSTNRTLRIELGPRALLGSTCSGKTGSKFRSFHRHRPSPSDVLPYLVQTYGYWPLQGRNPGLDIRTYPRIYVHICIVRCAAGLPDRRSRGSAQRMGSIHAPFLLPVRIPEATGAGPCPLCPRTSA